MLEKSKSMNKLQLFLLGGAAILIALAVLVFSGAFGFGGRGARTELIMWGTWESDPFREINRALQNNSGNAFTLSYIKKSPATYEQDLVEALAAGAGPDLWLIPAEWRFSRASLIAPLPAQFFNEREFKEQFVDVASLFIAPLRSEGRAADILALPLAFDPLVLYWNKDRFNAASIPLPPRDWTELMNDTSSLTRRNAAGQIEVAGAALGRASNIPLFKHILEALLLQENPRQNSFLQDASVANSATRYYTNFALSSRPHFSWHALLAPPRNLFLQNNLGMMIDYASLAPSFARQNPHLNFAVAPIPQINQTKPVTNGALWGITVSRASPKSAQAWQATLLLTGANLAPSLLAAANFAPARRDLLDSSNPLHAAVLQAKYIPDQHPIQTSAILAEMIDNVADGRKTVSEAINEAKRKFETIR